MFCNLCLFALFHCLGCYVQDATIPAFLPSYPHIALLLHTNVTISLKLTQLGSVYYLLQPALAPVPSLLQVYQGKDGLNNDAAPQLRGTANVASTVLVSSLELSGLQPRVFYTLYLLGVSDNLTVTTNVAKLEFTMSEPPDCTIWGLGMESNYITSSQLTASGFSPGGQANCGKT
jgi:hypothetical protein